MTAVFAVQAARLAAEALMIDSCIVTRSGGGRVWDEETGQYTQPAPLTVYTGKCKVKTRATGTSEAEVGEQQVGVLQWEVHLPVLGSEAVVRGDTITVTACQLDPALVGMTFTVTSLHAGSYKTSRRLPVEAVM